MISIVSLLALLELDTDRERDRVLYCRVLSAEENVRRRFAENPSSTYTNAQFVISEALKTLLSSKSTVFCLYEI